MTQTPPGRPSPAKLAWILLAVAALLIAVALLFPGARSLFAGWSVTGIRERLLALGHWAWLGSALLMLLQAIVSPLPAFVVTIANGYVFGAIPGGILALLSATLAAQVCFELARYFGRPALEVWVGPAVLAWADRFFLEQGVWAVLVARLLPFMPFDPISYAAGLTTTPRTRFLAANLVGQVPATFIYSTLGARLEDGHLPPGVLLGLSAAAAVIVCAWWIQIRRGKRRTRPAA